MKNIHINLNEFRNASRVLKQTKSLVSAKVFTEIKILALGSQDLDEFEAIDEKRSIIRIKLLSRSWPKSLPFQILKYFEFTFKAITILRKEKPSIVNIHSLGLLPLGIFSKLINKHKLVYDAHELETETNGLNGFRKKLSKWLERKLIHKADLMFVVSESIANWYVQEYGIERPPVVLNAPNRRALKTNNHFREQLGIREDQIILLYQGGLGAGRGVHLILDAFKVRQDDKVVAVFMGYGELEDEIKQSAEIYNTIYFYPAVLPNMVLEYTSSADAGIHLIQNTCLNHYYCMPNKLFECAMAGLPVLVSNMKDMSDLVSQNNMGTVISDFSAMGINSAIDAFLQQDLTSLKQNAYRVACENAWEVQEKKMMVAYNKFLEK